MTDTIVGPAPSTPATTDTEPALSRIEIKKAKIKGGHLTCEFTETQPAASEDEEAPKRFFSLECLGEYVHADLLRAFSRLVPHLCLLTEQLEDDGDFFPPDDEDLSAYTSRFYKFRVTGFSVGEDGNGLTLIGQRQLSARRVLNLTSPYVNFSDENCPYGYSYSLKLAWDEAAHEVELALRGKRGFEAPAEPDVDGEGGKQLDLFADNPDADSGNLQDLADMSGLVITASTNGGEETVIAAPGRGKKSGRGKQKDAVEGQQNG